MNLILNSFGFKYEKKYQGNLMFDVRILKNPYYEEHLRNQSGLDIEVYDYVLKQPLSRVLLDNMISIIDLYFQNNYDLEVYVGCTGGRHRSVAIIEYLKKYYAQKANVTICHCSLKEVLHNE